MAITATLYNSASPVEKIGKDLTPGNSYSCVLKQPTSVMDPVLLISTVDAVYNFNYLYIPDFHRYYFINDIRSINSNMWEISAHVDVLETYKDLILSNDAVIRRQQNRFNTYLNDPQWYVYAYESVVAYKFTSPFTKNLKYLLAVAGS